MALLKVRRFSQITLPVKIRKKFHLSEGDFLEVEEVKEGILLKPMAVIEREKAWGKVFQAMEGVEEKKSVRKQSLKAKEQEIARLVKASRKK